VTPHGALAVDAPERRPHTARQVLAIALAVGAAVPGLVARAAGVDLPEIAASLVFGLAVVGAAFVLAWAAEALELDVSAGLALAVLALIAVLPEYAVDFTFAAKAGGDPDTYAPLALANMTGGNRLLIGVGWPLVVLLAAWRLRVAARRGGYVGPIDTDVRLDRPHSIEIGFLAAATLYSLTLPLKGRLALWDAAILVALYAAYAVRIARSPAEEPTLVGPAEVFGALPPARRRIVVGLALAFAAAVIVLCAEPFADSLVATGEEFGISTFLLVQWLAPLASEAPELLVAASFAWRLNTNNGLATLLSSKVNQWTLLVGTLPLVFVIAGGAASGLPLDGRQREEILLTAAQSAFAVAVLVSRSISIREAWALLGLFLAQFVLGGVLPAALRDTERITIAIIYLVLAVGMVVRQRDWVRPLMRDAYRTPVRELANEPEPAT